MKLVKKIKFYTEVFNTKFIPLFFLFLFNVQFVTFQAQNPQWIVYTTQNSGLPSNEIGNIAIDNNNIKWIGTSNGMAKFNGISWYIYDTNNTPLPADRIYPLCVDRDNNIWVRVTDGYNSYGVAKFNGVNWTIYNTTNSGLLSNNISDIIIDSFNRKWIGTNYGLAEYNDTAWTVYTTTNSGLSFNLVSALALERYFKWIGYEYLENNLRLTKYNDTNWNTYVNPGILDENYDLCIDKNDNKWIATWGDGICKFNSVTNNWILYNTTNSGLPTNYTICIFCDNLNRKWIGTAGSGLARFNDTTWFVFSTYNSPLPSTTVNALALDSNHNLWIGTPNGLAEYNESGIIGIKNETQNVPLMFKLYQNYPNPFNPSTTIKFQISNKSFVNLSIYDIRGILIKTLENSTVSPGFYSITWDAGNNPSGVYLCVLKTEKTVSTIKLLLLK